MHSYSIIQCIVIDIIATGSHKKNNKGWREHNMGTAKEKGNGFNSNLMVSRVPSNTWKYPGKSVHHGGKTAAGHEICKGQSTERLHAMPCLPTTLASGVE